MKSNKLFLATVFCMMAMYSSAQFFGGMTDARDGKTYRTVQIGSQLWMADNLAYKVPDGSWVMDWKESNLKPYGYLYNFEAAKKACPSGWHLPSDAECLALVKYLGGETVAGGKLKEKGSAHWQPSNTGATNSTGFTAVPGGNYLYLEGKFPGKDGCYYWSSTEHDATNALYYYMLSHSNNIFRTYYLKTSGLSVRCIAN